MNNKKKNLLIYFARSPLDGEVKTRLKNVLDASARRTLYRAFLDDILSDREEIPGTDVGIACTPVTAVDFFKGYSPNLVFSQEGSGLGERIIHAFETGFALGYKTVVIRNTDSPTLPDEFIKNAFHRLFLDPEAVVLGPNPDGGYYLVGITRIIPEIFQGIPWGTADVLDKTIGILKSRRVPFQVLEYWYDVDRPEDLETLRMELQSETKSQKFIHLRKIMKKSYPYF